MLALLRPEPFVVIALELEELLEMWLAIQRTIYGRIVSGRQLSAARVTFNTVLVESAVINGDPLHRVHCLLTGITDIVLAPTRGGARFRARLAVECRGQSVTTRVRVR